MARGESLRTDVWCRDKPFPAKGAAAVGHRGEVRHCFGPLALVAVMHRRFGSASSIRFDINDDLSCLTRREPPRNKLAPCTTKQRILATRRGSPNSTALRSPRLRWLIQPARSCTSDVAWVGCPRHGEGRPSILSFLWNSLDNWGCTQSVACVPTPTFESVPHASWHVPRKACMIPHATPLDSRAWGNSKGFLEWIRISKCCDRCLQPLDLSDRRGPRRRFPREKRETLRTLC